MKISYIHENIFMIFQYVIVTGKTIEKFDTYGLKSGGDWKVTLIKAVLRGNFRENRH